MITQNRLKELLLYNPDTGVFTNLVSRGPRLAGTRAGTLHGVTGYRYITIEGVKYAEHQWAFLYMLGRLPRNEVDHIDDPNDDNRWGNLREATRVQNLANVRSRRDGLKGISRSSRNRWVARMRFKGRRLYLGNYSTEQKAHDAYMQKARELHGKFARADK